MDSAEMSSRIGTRVGLFAGLPAWLCLIAACSAVDAAREECATRCNPTTSDPVDWGQIAEVIRSGAVDVRCRPSHVSGGWDGHNYFPSPEELRPLRRWIRRDWSKLSTPWCSDEAVLREGPEVIVACRLCARRQDLPVEVVRALEFQVANAGSELVAHEAMRALVLSGEATDQAILAAAQRSCLGVLAADALLASDNRVRLVADLLRLEDSIWAHGVGHWCAAAVLRQATEPTGVEELVGLLIEGVKRSGVARPERPRWALANASAAVLDRLDFRRLSVAEQGRLMCLAGRPLIDLAEVERRARSGDPQIALWHTYVLGRLPNAKGLCFDLAVTAFSPNARAAATMSLGRWAEEPAVRRWMIQRLRDRRASIEELCAVVLVLGRSVARPEVESALRGVVRDHRNTLAHVAVRQFLHPV